LSKITEIWYTSPIQILASSGRLKVKLFLINLSQLKIAGLLFTFVAIAATGLVRCGKPKITASTNNVDGLPSTWDGGSDYESEGWGFESP
jgi:hypothetical protein